MNGSSKLDDGKLEEEVDEISESFRCCICLDLLYKPVVLACGHISCFWCIHHSMCGFSESHCPICRQPYYHFPSICQLLHLLLLKNYPGEYGRRKHQTAEKEKETGFFSPEFDTSMGQPSISKEHVPFHHVNHTFEKNASSKLMLENSHLNKSSEEHVLQYRFVSPIENGFPETSRDEGSRKSEVTSKEVSVNDALCACCNQLLFRPLVLNCGHVFCESCIGNRVDKSIWCQDCKTQDPRGVPKICLELDHFLEETFPKEYDRRRHLMSNKTHLPNGHVATGVALTLREQNGPKVHIGVGCDYCGMYPIIGERYKCKDCVEKIGFDLCGPCHDSRNKLPGRFNQQHTADHQFQRMGMHFRHDLISRMMGGRLLDGSGIPLLSPAADDTSVVINSLPDLVRRTMEENPSSLVLSISSDEEDGGFALESPYYVDPEDSLSERGEDPARN